jgi:hypothetical protein
LFAPRNECATAGDYGIVDFFEGVASMSRAVAWNLLCHSVTQARSRVGVVAGTKEIRRMGKAKRAHHLLEIIA